MPNNRIEKFKGLNNVSDPLRLGLGWLARADNVDIDDTGAISDRDGFDLFLAGSLTGAFSTSDFSRLYIVDAGSLKRVGGPTLATGITSAPMHWCEVSKDVYYTNGVNSGILRQDDIVDEWSWPVPTEPVLAALSGSLPAGQYQVVCTYLLPDGRETGASPPAVIDLAADSALQMSSIPQVAGMRTRVYIAPANSTVFHFALETSLLAWTWNASPDTLGEELVTATLFPLPVNATHPTLWQGSLYVMEYFPSSDITVVWYSEPLGFHLFDLRTKFIVVKGRGTMLAAHDAALMIGTDERVYSWNGESLTTEADYGVIAGWPSAMDDDTGEVYFWTERGACKAMPFANITERQISVAPGTQVGAAIVKRQGQKKFVAVLHRGGTAFNSNS